MAQKFRSDRNHESTTDLTENFSFGSRPMTKLHPNEVQIWSRSDSNDCIGESLKQGIHVKAQERIYDTETTLPNYNNCISPQRQRKSNQHKMLHNQEQSNRGNKLNKKLKSSSKGNGRSQYYSRELPDLRSSAKGHQITEPKIMYRTQNNDHTSQMHISYPLEERVASGYNEDDLGHKEFFITPNQERQDKFHYKRKGNFIDSDNVLSESSEMYKLRYKNKHSLNRNNLEIRQRNEQGETSFHNEKCKMHEHQSSFSRNADICGTQCDMFNRIESSQEIPTLHEQLNYSESKPSGRRNHSYYDHSFMQATHHNLDAHSACDDDLNISEMGSMRITSHPFHTVHNAKQIAKQLGLLFAESTETLCKNDTADNLHISCTYQGRKRKCWSKFCWSLERHSHTLLETVYKSTDERSHFDHRVLDYNTMKTKMDHQRQEIKEFTHDVWNGIKSPFAIWSSDLKRIEGHYGTGVLSFFLFLRWMVYLNLLMTVLVILFIVIPENIFHSKEQNIFNSSLTNIDFNFADKNHLRNSECEQQYNNKSIACLNSKSGVPVDILAFCSHNYTASIERKDAIIEMMQEFLQGTGWMELTPMFIGWYKPTVLRHIDILPIYDLPIAYMLVTVSYFLLCLILMVFYTRKSIRENILKTESQLQRYCNMVFSGWDFSIEDKKLAEIKHGNILQNFRSHLAEARRFAEVSQWSTSKKVRVTFLRVVINIFVVMILGVSGFGIYKAIIIADKISGTTGFEGLLIEYLPSIIITALNLFLPLLFEFLAKFEHYSLSFTIKVTLIRCVFSQLASICILVGTLHGLIMCDDKTDCGSGYGDCKAPLCWETYVGQQMYKLAMLDFFTALLLTFLVGYPRKVITEKCQSKLAQFIGREEFNIPKNVLNLVYSQTLCWLGAFYSPFLPLLSVMNFIIIFYLKKFALIVNCAPAKESYKASRSNSFFMIVLMLSYLIGVFSFVYSISIIMPSRGCGPFRTYDTAWDVVTISISKFPPQAIATLHFIGSAGFGVPAFIILSLLLYYYLTLSATYSQTAEVLKGHLLVEGRDKHFLLKKLMIILRQPEQ